MVIIVVSGALQGFATGRFTAAHRRPKSMRPKNMHQQYACMQRNHKRWAGDSPSSSCRVPDPVHSDCHLRQRFLVASASAGGAYVFRPAQAQIVAGRASRLPAPESKPDQGRAVASRERRALLSQTGNIDFLVLFTEITTKRLYQLLIITERLR